MNCLPSQHCEQLLYAAIAIGVIVALFVAVGVAAVSDLDDNKKV